MNFQSLYYFVVVAEEENISHAAEKLYISQQSLSSHINRLEDELKVKLFDRTPRLSLTYAGICTLRTARQILDLEKQMYAQLDDITNQKIGSLTLGCTYVRARTLLPEILPQYMKEYPKIELHTAIGNKSEIWEKLLLGKLDLVILNRPEEHPLVESILLIQDPFCAVIPRRLLTQRFFNHAQMVADGWLERGEVDFSMMEDAPILLPQGTTIRARTDLYFSRCHLRPNIILEANDVETIFGLCAKGVGITFSYEGYAKSLLRNVQNPDEEVLVFPIRDEALAGQVKISYLKSRYQGKIVQAFIRLARETMGSAT